MAQAEGRLKTWAMLLIAVGMLVIFLFGSCDSLGLLVLTFTAPSALRHPSDAATVQAATGILGAIGASLVPIGLAIVTIRWANRQRR